MLGFEQYLDWCKLSDDLDQQLHLIHTSIIDKQLRPFIKLTISKYKDILSILFSQYDWYENRMID